MRSTTLLVLSLLVLSAATGALAQDQETPSDDGLDDIRSEYRSARTAVVMSIPMPGWGQLYSDAPFWGVVAFGAEMFYLGSILMENRRQERQKVKRDQETDPNRRATRSAMVDEHGERARDYVWWAAGVYLIVGLDAFVSVELADFDSEDPPTPDLDREWPNDDDDGDGLALKLNFSF